MSGRKLSLIITLFIVLSFIYIRFNYKRTSSLTINNMQILIEVADTYPKRSKGLSDRQYLEKDYGMLFIFPDSGYYNFWMNDMQFPLDFVWIKDNNVVDLTENVPQPKNMERPLTFTAKSEFNKVLEINNGKIKEWGIKVGDKVTF